MSLIDIFASFDLGGKPLRAAIEGRAGQILSDLKYQLGSDKEGAPYRFSVLPHEANSSSDGTAAAECEGFRLETSTEEALVGCDIAVALVSRDYFDCKRCIAEFQKLLASAKPLVVVQTENVSETVYPTLLERARPSDAEEQRPTDIVDVQFWGDKERFVFLGKVYTPVLFERSDNGWLQEEDKSLYRKPLPGSVSGGYELAIELTKVAIEEHAKRIIDNRPYTSDASQADEESDEPEHRYTVCLAAPTVDVREEADRLATRLTNEGYSVFRINYGATSHSFQSIKKTLETAIRKCDFYVQLLGGQDGRALEGTKSRTLVPAQHEVAVACTEKMEPPQPLVLLWQPLEFDENKVSGPYRKFLATVDKHTTNFQDFEEFLLKTIERSAHGRKVIDAIIDARKASRLPAVAIDAAQSDARMARLMLENLEDRVNVSLLPYEINRELLQDAAVTNDAVILVYGNTRDGQKRAVSHFPHILKFQRLSKLRSTSSSDQTLAISDGADDDDPPCPKGPGVLIIRVTGDEDELKVDTDALKSFLEKIGVDSTVPDPSG